MAEEQKPAPTASPPPAAEPEQPAASSWLPSAPASWLQAAKERVESTLDSVKKDLHEFTDTVQTEASALASATAQSVKQQAHMIQQLVHSDTAPAAEPKPEAEESAEGGGGLFGAGVNLAKSLLESVQKMGGSLEDTTAGEDLFTREIRVGGPRRSVLEQCQLQQIQNDERTFTQPPHERIELYREWLGDFKLGEYNGEINLLLSHNPRLRELYSKLVPALVDNHTFWNRYFFKVHLAETEKESAAAKSAPSSSQQLESDETWSMCSGPASDSTNGELISEKDIGEEDADREDAATPRQQSEQEFHSGDEWEKLEGKKE